MGALGQPAGRGERTRSFTLWAPLQIPPPQLFFLPPTSFGILHFQQPGGASVGEALPFPPRSASSFAPRPAFPGKGEVRLSLSRAWCCLTSAALSSCALRLPDLDGLQVGPWPVSTTAPRSASAWPGSSRPAPLSGGGGGERGRAEGEKAPLAG